MKPKTHEDYRNDVFYTILQNYNIKSEDLIEFGRELHFLYAHAVDDALNNMSDRIEYDPEKLRVMLSGEGNALLTNITHEVIGRDVGRTRAAVSMFISKHVVPEIVRCLYVRVAQRYLDEKRWTCDDIDVRALALNRTTRNIVMKLGNKPVKTVNDLRQFIDERRSLGYDDNEIFDVRRCGTRRTNHILEAVSEFSMYR